MAWLRGAGLTVRFVRGGNSGRLAAGDQAHRGMECTLLNSM